MRGVLISLIAGLSSPALLRELPDPQWIVLVTVFGLALAMQWQSGLDSNLRIASHNGSNGSSSYSFLKWSVRNLSSSATAIKTALTIPIHR